MNIYAVILITDTVVLHSNVVQYIVEQWSLLADGCQRQVGRRVVTCRMLPMHIPYRGIYFPLVLPFLPYLTFLTFLLIFTCLTFLTQLSNYYFECKLIFHVNTIFFFSFFFLFSSSSNSFQYTVLPIHRLLSKISFCLPFFLYIYI